ncbi:DUF3761 domain-containing protein [Nocardia jejuensis]|uniref:DUF3761 domain-containing protein n=1 Tax=Nocardia jejuensis TaxID=328049 RepID=UPI001FDF3732|nr:DUF3761 domain-containing protein [Nocardia jejuensis]
MLPAISAGVLTAAALLAPAAQAAPLPTAACGSGQYQNTAGDCVNRPQQAPSAPAGASARCKDGTYSSSKTRSGTCSHHGGVSEWL